MVDAVSLAPEFALILVTATVLGYIVRRIGQPVLIGHIATGLVLGPVVLGVVTQTELIEVMAELGLGFLLFLIGLQMRIEEIRDILGPIVNLTILGTIAQTALALAVAWVLGFGPTETLIIGLASVFGATPVIVKVLTDNDQFDTLPARIDIGALVLQNIYLVVLLTVLGAESLSSPLEIALSIGTVLVLMAVIGVFSYVSARYVLPAFVASIADNREALFVVAIAWAFLFIAGSERLDLSLEMGAFIAGISLAQVPQSIELSEWISPITDFFMLVFFASIGLQLAPEHLLAYWREALVASVVLMVANFLVVLVLIYREGFSMETSFVGSLNMVQVSEFSLVLGALAVAQGFIEPGILGYLSLVAIVTMSLSTPLLNANYDLYRRAEPYLSKLEPTDRRDADIDIHRNHAVVVGHDELTWWALPMLAKRFDRIVVVDRNPANIDEHEQADYSFIYGDAKHGEIRKAAAIERAAFVLSSSVQTEINEIILEDAPDSAMVFVEADTPENAAILYDAGADYVILGDALAGERTNEYLKLYLYDREFFTDIVRPRLARIRERAGGAHGKHGGVGDE